MVYDIPEAPIWFSETLTRHTLEAGCLLSDKQVELLKIHAEWVFFWNRVTNLTSAKDWEELIYKHYLDAIIPAYRWLPQRGRFLDIGSGAGFPGIPIKILFPELEMTLCELRRRKASFLKSFIAHVRLDNIRIIQLKWHEIISQYFEKFDIITVRALKLQYDEIANLVGYGLKKEGVLALWTTPSLVKESDLTECFAQDNITTDLSHYSLPGGIERAIILVKKK